MGVVESTGTPEPRDEAEQIQTSTSLADHREEFPQRRPTRAPIPRAAPAIAAGDQDSASMPRRRAKSHVASPDDVEQIAALTKRLRAAEDAIKIEQKPGESDRVFQLRRRAELAERANATQAATVQPAAAVSVPVSAAPERTGAATVPTNGQPSATEFTEHEPTLEQFAAQPDPYAAWQRALGAYDRKKERFEEQQAASKTEQDRATKAQFEKWNADIQAGQQEHVQRIGAYLTAHPEAKARFDAEAAKPADDQIALPPALRAAIEFHEHGPAMIDALIQQPDFADELFLLTNGYPVSDPRHDPLVAKVRRRLLQRVSGVTTGAPNPPRPSPVAPRPPTPVRTVPQTPREKESRAPTPGSLAEHRRQFPHPRSGHSA